MKRSSIQIKRYLSNDKKILVCQYEILYFKNIFDRIFRNYKLPKVFTTIIELDTGYYLKPDIHFKNFHNFLKEECKIISRELLIEGRDF